MNMASNRPNPARRRSHEAPSVNPFHPVATRCMAACLAWVCLLACAGLAVAQQANEAASIDDEASVSDETPGLTEETPAVVLEAREPSLGVGALEARLAALVTPRNRPRPAAEVEALEAVAEAARAGWAASGEAPARRRLALVELRARQALVGLADAAGRTIQTAIRSTQLRAAAGRVSGSGDAELARLGGFFAAVAALGELQRDPGRPAAHAASAAETLARLRGATAPPAPGNAPGNAPGDAPGNAAVRDAATLALGLLHGRALQRPRHAPVLAAAAALARQRSDPPGGITARLDRYRRRADLLAEPMRLSELFGDTLPDRRAGSPRPAATLVHYFQPGAAASLAPIYRLRGLRERHGEPALAIVSVGVGERGASASAWPEEAAWPVLAAAAGGLGVAALDVAVVPTFALFDGGGRLVAVGESDAVIDAAGALLADGPGPTGR